MRPPAAALRLALGGGVAAVASLTAGDAGAGRRNRNRCRGIGATCTRDRDCCTRTCLANRCRIAGSEQCGDRTCLPGFRCCRNDDAERTCTPRGFPNRSGSFSFADGFKCCRSAGSGVNGACPTNATCCSSRLGAGCCPKGMKCCHGGGCPEGMVCCDNGCCPDSFRCASHGCVIDSSSAVGARRTAKQRPFTERLAIDAADMIEVAPRAGEAAPEEAAA